MTELIFCKLDITIEIIISVNTRASNQSSYDVVESVPYILYQPQ
ncbi:hypothetical protein Cylst_0049 [Cylindrospermum stagnale PCC 7417]|uniref:Uncharacterized protein n=1 Tax=Cylindrospermum stagnale PCC 7417 TaxID=56107 RepID=K9WRM0_9NOST|nr:hypothetical protein Cylst_0049 [Cylindrospermum stagnale PCC 7417]